MTEKKQFNDNKEAFASISEKLSKGMDYKDQSPNEKAIMGGVTKHGRLLGYLRWRVQLILWAVDLKML